MRVKELKLHNFRGIKDLHLVFNPDCNVVVLAGINGVGKSSILDCINFLFKYYAMIHNVYYLAEHELIGFLPARFARIVPDFNEILSLSDIQNGENGTSNRILFDRNSNTIEWQSAKFKNDSRQELWSIIHEQSKENVVRQEIPIGSPPLMVISLAYLNNWREAEII